MFPGINNDLSYIDTPKTAIINNEVLRLDVDIAALQKTRLPVLKEKDYTFYVLAMQAR